MTRPAALAAFFALIPALLLASEGHARQSAATPLPLRQTVSLGDEVGISQYENDCIGYVGAAPVLVLDYRPGDRAPAALEILVQSDADSVLQVFGPGPDAGLSPRPGRQQWCGDDGAGGTNPLVSIETPWPGRYEVYAGVYRQGEVGQGMLTVRERP